jgi:hypothetical protein
VFKPIKGSNLVDESLVEFGGVVIPTSPVKGTLLRETMFHPVYTQLTAVVPAHLLSRVASYQVVVRNPPPEGGTSNILNFFVSP